MKIPDKVVDAMTTVLRVSGATEAELNAARARLLTADLEDGQGLDFVLSSQGKGPRPVAVRFPDKAPRMQSWAMRIGIPVGCILLWELARHFFWPR